MAGQIQHDMSTMNVTPGIGNGVGNVGGSSAFEQQVAQLLGVDAEELSGALRSAEQDAAAEIRALAADGEYSAADRQQVEANMIDRVLDTLGLDRNSLSNEQMMALTNLCRECLAGVENEVLGQNGLSAEQSLFSPQIGNGLVNGALAGFEDMRNGAFDLRAAYQDEYLRQRFLLQQGRVTNTGIVAAN